MWEWFFLGLGAAAVWVLCWVWAPALGERAQRLISDGGYGSEGLGAGRVGDDALRDGDPGG